MDTTCGKIKGYLQFKNLYEMVLTRYDKNATGKETIGRSYTPNQSKEDAVYGTIYFECGDGQLELSYDYDPAGSLPYDDEKKAPVTTIRLDGCRNAKLAELFVKEIVEHFGGRWIKDWNSDKYRTI